MTADTATDSKKSRRRRALRRISLIAIVGYLTLSVLGNAAIWVGVATGRLLDRDPRTRDASLPAIKHLRKVDDRLWVGAQASKEHYRDLSELGVRTVVDVRTGTDTDPRPDDPGFLRSLGIDYVWLPVTDGRVPDERTVDRFVEIVGRNEGIVFMHCGGGVGRSTSLTAAYQAARGENPSLLEQMAVGPMSFEQAWFIGAVGEGDPWAHNVFVEGFSRYVVDAPRVLWGKATH